MKFQISMIIHSSCFYFIMNIWSIFFVAILTAFVFPLFKCSYTRFYTLLIRTIFNLQLEQRVSDVEQFYLSTDNMQLTSAKCASAFKDKVKEKQLTSIEKQQQEASHREAGSLKRMQDLMREFSTILRHVSMNSLIFLWRYLSHCQTPLSNLNTHVFL